MTSISSTFYRDHIQANSGMSPEMPLVHVCDCYTFRDILLSQTISPTKCPVFGEDLAYFFYGRPSYRLSDGGLATTTPSLFPVCFILDPSLLKHIKRVFPFDSGAFSGGLYSSFVHKSAKFDDYSFDPTYEFICKYVDMFYSSNSNYFNGTPTITVADIPAMAFELHSLYQMISSPVTAIVDDRCSTVEIQSMDKISINSGLIKAIVLPGDVMSDPVLSAFIFDNDIEPLTYDTTRCAPNTLTPLIIDKVRQYFTEEGII